ncbi:MAG: hypothetical protein U9N57_07120 [Pseudomonadota bacterium]|nr:hypothetical protein [Pseudomonadota bacterium]
MPTNKILILDRNIVSIIKSVNEGSHPLRPDQLEMICYLRRNDRNVTAVTPLLSIIEGQAGAPESPDEMEKTIEEEGAALQPFFQKARVDSGYLLASAKSTSQIFVDSDAQYNAKYDCFLKEANQLLVNKVKKNDRWSVKEKVCDLACKHGVPLGHPVVMCCLSALFGLGYSRKLLKFKQSGYEPYNARSDLLIISRLFRIKHSAKKVNPNIRVKFLSLDKALQEFISMVDVTSTVLQEDGIELEVHYNKKLFPDLTEKEYLKLAN